MIRRSSKKGQMLIEAMIGIAILTVGFLGIMSLLSHSFFFDRATANELTASYLASEGIEVAKNIVDHDIYASSWGATFASAGVSVGGVPVDFQMDNTTCTGAGPCSLAAYSGAPLDWDPTTDLYGYAAGNASIFTRRIRVSMPSANEIQVNSTVTWSTGPLTSQSLNLEDHFYNWHP